MPEEKNASLSVEDAIKNVGIQQPWGAMCCFDTPWRGSPPGLPDGGLS